MRPRITPRQFLGEPEGPEGFVAAAALILISIVLAFVAVGYWTEFGP